MLNVHEHAGTKWTHTCSSVRGSEVEVPWTTFLWKSLGAEVDEVGGGTKGRILYLHSCGVWGQSLKMKGRWGSRFDLASLLDQCLLVTPLWSRDHQLWTFTNSKHRDSIFYYVYLLDTHNGYWCGSTITKLEESQMKKNKTSYWFLSTKPRTHKHAFG